MTRVLLFVTVGFLFAAAGAFGGSQPEKKDVRSPTGKLLYKTITRGNTTEVRTPTGKLLYKSKTKNGRTEVRSPTGKLLFKSK